MALTGSALENGVGALTSVLGSKQKFCGVTAGHSLEPLGIRMGNIQPSLACLAG